MVSIIIRTYNEGKYLFRLLELISKQNFTNFEVIVVDSGSLDNTLNICNNFKKKQLKIIHIKKPDFSFGKSLNLGIQEAKGEFCTFISGHCLPYDENWLKNTIKHFDDLNVGIVYGKQVGDKNTKISEHIIFSKWFFDKDIIYQENNFCNNANCTIRKKLWLNQKYDEYITGLEDIKFADYHQKQGTKINYASDSIVYHIHDETYNKIFNRYKRESITYSSLYNNEKFNFKHFIFFTIKNIINDIIKMKKIKNNNKINKNYFYLMCSIVKFRLSQFYGTYKGYRYTKNNNNLRKKFYY